MKYHILIVDDNKAIHSDIKKILTIPPKTDVDLIRNALFDYKTERSIPDLEFTSVFQGEEAVEFVNRSFLNQKRFAIAFVDIRMPPGFDGIQTIKKIWELDPQIQIIICTAYSDYTFQNILKELKQVNQFLILKKPFDPIEIKQATVSLLEKWSLNKKVLEDFHNLTLMNVYLDFQSSQYQTILNSIDEGILVINKNDEIIYYNEKFYEVCNLSEEILQQCSGSQLFEELAKQKRHPEKFIKLMQGLVDNLVIENNLEWRTSTDKYLEIYAHPQYYNNKVINSVITFRDITQRKTLEEKLLYHATHDLLTNIPNRFSLQSYLQQLFLNIDPKKNLVGVFILDIDNFKEINDTLGHDHGDELLKMVANIINAELNETEIVSRMGGDEFVVICQSSTDVEYFTQKAERIISKLCRQFVIHDKSINVTVSIGISIYPNDDEDMGSLFKKADIALYNAKSSGKNNYKFYLSTLGEHYFLNKKIAKNLQTALANKELFLLYQPIYQISTMKPVGIEALIRWNNPELGILEPEKFIQIAEASRLIISIGNWVFHTACQDFKIIIKNKLKLAINVSPYQFKDEKFLDHIHAIVQECDFPYTSLELEFTESLILDNSRDMVQKMKKLREKGITLTIDDFGTGYTSLSYLKYLPFDKIKIDKSYIVGMEKNLNEQTIVKALINLAKTLGLTVIAEGVENKEQLDLLAEMQCDFAQGFYLNNPLYLPQLHRSLFSEKAK